VFREVRRALRDDRTIWVNMGDSYASGGSGGGGRYMAERGDHAWQGKDNATGWRSAPAGWKHKDLLGLPWRLAITLQDDSWYLRQGIIWHKPNPMPESIKDRCTQAHEYLFLLSKGPHYYFDQNAIREPATASGLARWSQDIDAQAGSERIPGKNNGPMKAVGRSTAPAGPMSTTTRHGTSAASGR